MRKLILIAIIVILNGCNGSYKNQRVMANKETSTNRFADLIEEQPQETKQEKDLKEIALEASKITEDYRQFEIEELIYLYNLTEKQLETYTEIKNLDDNTPNEEMVVLLHKAENNFEAGKERKEFALYTSRYHKLCGRIEELNRKIQSYNAKYVRWYPQRIYNTPDVVYVRPQYNTDTYDNYMDEIRRSHEYQEQKRINERFQLELNNNLMNIQSTLQDMQHQQSMEEFRNNLPNYEKYKP